MQRPRFALSLISLTLTLAACGGGEGTAGTPGVAVVPTATPTGGTGTGSTPAAISQTASVSVNGGTAVTVTLAPASGLRAQTENLPDDSKRPLYKATLPDTNAPSQLDMGVLYDPADSGLYILTLTQPDSDGSSIKLACISSKWTEAQYVALVPQGDTEPLNPTGDSSETIPPVVLPARCDGTVVIDPAKLTLVATGVTLVQPLLTGDNSAPIKAKVNLSLNLPVVYVPPPAVVTPADTSTPN